MTMIANPAAIQDRSALAGTQPAEAGAFALATQENDGRLLHLVAVDQDGNRTVPERSVRTVGRFADLPGPLSSTWLNRLETYGGFVRVAVKPGSNLDQEIAAAFVKPRGGEMLSALSQAASQAGFDKVARPFCVTQSATPDAAKLIGSFVDHCRPFAVHDDNAMPKR